MHDTGVPVNYAEAVKWYSKAAEQGHAAAQSNLGLMYVLGIGVPEDYVKAHMWFSISKANGDGTAAKGLANVKKRMLSARRL
jgi:TPR repeat protein